MGDALVPVVNHHDELVGPQAVCALDDEVANRLRDVLLLRAKPAVIEVYNAIWNTQPPGPGALAGCQPIAASARVGAMGQLLACAGTTVNQAIGTASCRERVWKYG